MISLNQRILSINGAIDNFFTMNFLINLKKNIASVPLACCKKQMNCSNDHKNGGPVSHNIIWCGTIRTLTGR